MTAMCSRWPKATAGITPSTKAAPAAIFQDPVRSAPSSGRRIRAESQRLVASASTQSPAEAVSGAMPSTRASSTGGM